MAPVLTMLFTPLFAVMLACAAVVYAVTGLGGAFDRELLSVFDALLVVVLALVLYGMSARDPSTSPDWMDGIQLVAVVSALVLDVMVLGAMIARIGDLGFTPNRTAALGLNLVLLVNLAGAAWLSARFLTRTQQAPPARALADDLPSRLRAVGRRGRRGHPPTTVRLRLIATTPDHTDRGRARPAARSLVEVPSRTLPHPLASTDRGSDGSRTRRADPARGTRDERLDARGAPPRGGRPAGAVEERVEIDVRHVEVRSEHPPDAAVVARRSALPGRVPGGGGLAFRGCSSTT